MILKRKGFILLLECLQMTGDTDEVELHCGQETGSSLLKVALRREAGLMGKVSW